MSLTSYRAAPPRVNLFGSFKERKGAPFCGGSALLFFEIVEEDFKHSVLGRPGSDLLSQVLRHSTIGAEAFNGRVRDGIGFRRLAKATRPAKDRELRSIFCEEGRALAQTQFETKANYWLSNLLTA